MTAEEHLADLRRKLEEVEAEMRSLAEAAPSHAIMGRLQLAQRQSAIAWGRVKEQETARAILASWDE